ncbi:hypothetical protein SO802_015234 [Lithocarpus litseifolius]|uniref:Uncharacterized protein n=1 Tax=Lithocarpus litseifolius TaxID=425828 RepID=A0AAW2CV85_9ROSI
MPEIDIILYHGGLIKNANANKELPFEGPGIKFYYTQIDHRLKILDELKMIVMEELCVNLAVHNIQITYRMPHEVLKNRINYKYMAIETDKHVKIQYEYSTHVEDDDVHVDVDDNDNDDDDDDDNDDDYVDETTVINSEDFVDRDEFEERIE